MIPHLHIHEGDETGVTLRIIKSDAGIACFNYVFGAEMKIVIVFDLNVCASVVANYVSDCLNQNTTHTIVTNFGTVAKNFNNETALSCLTSSIEYLNAIQFARYP